jgi:hypothetical protein
MLAPLTKGQEVESSNLSGPAAQDVGSTAHAVREAATRVHRKGIEPGTAHGSTARC